MTKSNVTEIKDSPAAKALKKSEHLQNQISAVAEVMEDRTKQQIGINAYNQNQLIDLERAQWALAFAVGVSLGIGYWLLKKQIKNSSLRAI